MKYFDITEFKCKCGCDAAPMDVNFLERLDHARYYAGVPFVINSGYRCPIHNSKVGSKSTSAHVKGLAVDIKCDNSPARRKILHALFRAGFHRIGIAKDFIHADDGKSLPADVVWLY